MDEQRVQFSVEAGCVGLARLNRPSVRNAIDEPTRAELQVVLDRVANDPSIRALVLTGNGPAFCAGGDISAMRQRMQAPAGSLGANGWLRQRRLHGMVGALHSLEKPTIAAVNGAAAGLGMDMALCCDFIVASEQAFFTMSYVQRGLIPDGGGLYFLPRRVGLPKAKELIFSARRVMADEALRIGLADRVAAAAELVSNAVEWATELGTGAGPALALSKAIIDQTFELTADQAFALGAQAQAICYTTDEHHQAVAAFLNRVRT
ncbi:MAG: enoyl-CoA hydratase/isomerase family protein [Chloroflexi bacterium]|nr:enoyl-CoA hydratase/isomerase family protein [Chloroflexota bacterium]MBV9898140.1 enoyl-CoA hydratase/isomerase family protein [Chloroflexota bacterium]